MFLSRVIQKFKSSAQKRPLFFNSVIYGSFYTGAEFTQQTYSKIFKFSSSSLSINSEETDTSKTEKPLFVWIRKFDQMLGLLNENDSTQSRSYNWPQLKRYAIYGCFIAGPVLHGWYKWLDMFYKGKTIKIIVTKLLVDQFILTPPLIALFFISMSSMEGKSNVFDECKTKFLQTFKTSCMYWLPVQFLNFLLIPPVLRVSFVSVAAFCWANILCYLKSTPVSTCYDNQIKY
ncbi:Mpv17-like protein 2 [Melipona quadrifasciata]|uniref:Mpv17-like protein 2 n=1 Tax=Melipona quadrifasciata TaxID=166423 RepID=A0A0M9A953_9HYME|nr:Mpv17-like protein 2 [Melipona quadrifasciata]